MTKNGRWIAPVLMALATTCWAGDTIFRPQVGVGSMNAGRYDHAGFRLLLPSNDQQSYGLELSNVSTPTGIYQAVGIVLEQRLWGWFNMSIGTIGYMARDSVTPNAPGIVANLGWEPHWKGALKPFVTYRNDFIYASEVQRGHALSVGLAVGF